MALVKIRDPRKPGDYLWLSENDFDKTKHRLFESEPPASEIGAEPEAETKSKPKRRG